MEALENLPVSAVDLGIVAILLVSGLLAYVRGLVHEVLSMGAWIGAIFATVFLYPAAQPYARELVPINLVADLFTGVVIFILTLVILSLATRAASTRVKESALNILDRSLGFLFGLVRGAVIICAAYLGLEFMLPRADQPSWLTSARSMPLIQMGAAEIYALIPADAHMDIPAVESEDVTQDILKLIVPDTLSPELSEQDDGYSDGERGTIKNLIESSQ